MSSSVRPLPTVSFLFPCLNEAAIIRRCIETVDAQFACEPALTYDIVVVDNGSADRSAAIPRSVGARVVNVTQRGYGSASRDVEFASELIIKSAKFNARVVEVPSGLKTTVSREAHLSVPSLLLLGIIGVQLV